MWKNILLLLLVNLYVGSSISWLSFTDSHIDLEYKENTANNCLFWSKIGTKCCRSSSIPKKPYNLSSKWGDVNCDIPPLLFENIMNWVKSNIIKKYNISFIVNTGDDCSHKDISQPFMNENVKTINYVSNIMIKYFGDIPYYYTYGNHDEYIVDQTPPIVTQSFIEQSSKYLKWVDDINLKKYGYYSVLEEENGIYYKIISFNSIYYDTDNNWIINSTYEDSRRINNQFEWLENELVDAVNNSNKVIFLNHIPIFSGESSNYNNQNLIELLYKYSSNIILNSNGHTHRNSFRLIKRGNEYVNYAYIPLSITTDNHFPSFRIYIYNNTYNILDYVNYICNLTKIIENNNVICEEEYIFSKEYDLSGINLENTIKLYEKISNNDTYFQKYYKHYNSGGVQEICNNEECKKNYLNEILNVI